MVDSQVFKHEGRTGGQGAVDTAPLELLELVGTTAGVEDASCSHRVQMVELLAMRIVEVEVPTDVLVIPFETWVNVTGQTVVLVHTISVRVVSSDPAELDVWAGDEDEEAAGVDVGVSVAVTGQTVVETATTTVARTVE